MANRYDGILICTDLDGTMVASDGTVSDRNAAAVMRFERQGGLFSVATGRLPSHFATLGGKFMPNAPVVTFNGAAIVDLAKEKTIVTRPLRRPLARLVRELEPFADALDRVMLYSAVRAENLPYAELSRRVSELAGEPWLKLILIFRAEEDALAAKKRLEASPSAEQCDFSRSWSLGLEVLDREATKGHAVRRLRGMLPSVKKVVCIGDYENDISMLREADLGIAVDNALPCVKSAADGVTVSNDEDAIAALIDAL